MPTTQIAGCNTLLLSHKPLYSIEILQNVPCFLHPPLSVQDLETWPRFPPHYCSEKRWLLATLKAYRTSDAAQWLLERATSSSKCSLFTDLHRHYHLVCVIYCGVFSVRNKLNFTVLLRLTFRHRASCILGQAFHYSPENAFYIFSQQIYFIIWYLLDRASLI